MRSNVWTGASLVAAMCCLPGLLQAADGVLIVQKTTTGATAQISQTQIERNRMRAEVAGGVGGVKRVVIFDGTRQIMWLVDADKKSYSEMTKADADRMGGQLQDAMSQMQAQLANLPPAQRAQIEAMMKGRGMPGAAAAAQKNEYRKAGTDKVGKWTCNKYEGFQNNEKTSEVCTVEPAALGLALADFDVSRQLGEFFQKLMPQNGDQVFTIGTIEEHGYSGVPVRRKFTIAGRETTTEVTDVTRQTFADATFVVPDGFKKEDLLGGLAGRGRGR
ncbi:MAG: hypothetical protein ABJA98_35530 [Acidobacteriota bacterium]